MKNYLYVGLCCLMGQTLAAQQVYPVQTDRPILKNAGSADANCNFAGAFPVSQDTIFLCQGDSLLIEHDGAALLDGDPQPATPAGVSLGFYSCLPSVSGDQLLSVLLDPCLLNDPPAPSGLYVTPGIPNGGQTWLFNQGQLQDIFNDGKPLLVYFAPITIDDWQGLAYESAGPGSQPGPCVHVNTAAAFPVVYLNPIAAGEVETNLVGNNCIGRFRLNGGYPQFNNLATYDIRIESLNDPDAKGILHLPEGQWFAQTTFLFSVNQPDQYRVEIQDGVGCGLQFEMDMSGCNPTDNIHIAFDSLELLPGAQVCLPLRVRQFEVVAATFSLQWDPALLEYQGYSALHPAISGFFNPNEFLNLSQTEQGKMGVSLYNLSWPGDVIQVPNGESLFSLCFLVSDSLHDCTLLTVDKDPSILAFEDEEGRPLAFGSMPGAICPNAVSSDYSPEITAAPSCWPNPIERAGSFFIEGFNEAPQARLFNSIGQQIGDLKLLQWQGQRLQGKLPDLAPGMYLLQLQTAHEKSQVFKLNIY